MRSIPILTKSILLRTNSLNIFAQRFETVLFRPYLSALHPLNSSQLIFHKMPHLNVNDIQILILQVHCHFDFFCQPKMTKSESFSWQSTNKGCTGLNDFGLLRDNPEHDQKPKAYSVYFSRTVLIVGIVAGFTLAVR